MAAANGPPHDDTGARHGEDRGPGPQVGAGLLAHYLPYYSFGHRYAALVPCGDIARVYAIARNVDMARSRWILLLFRLRGLPRSRLRAQAFCTAMGWTELVHAPPREFIIAYWRGGPGNRIRRIADPAQFAAPTEGATQKVAFSFRFVQHDGAHVAVITETRVLCIGWRSWLAFYPYWLMIKPFSGLVRTEILRLIAKQACADQFGAGAAP